jgi:hypothetical protein
MAQNPGQYYRFEQPRSAEAVAAWTIAILVVIDFLFLGVVAWKAWTVEKESRRVFALLEASADACVQTSANGAPVRYDNDRWKTSFELPAGHLALENFISDEHDVEVRVGKRPAADDAATPNTLYDTSVRVRIGKATGFSRYYAKPYSDYGGYRRFTAVGRAAIGYTDPAGAADSVQVILIDDTRFDREIAITYTAIQEGAENLAFDIIDTMRLAPLERQEVVAKPGWKIFSQTPLRFQYPEDYRVSTPFPGRVEVIGRGGRLEIVSAYNIGESGARGATTLSNGDGGTPDEFFLLQYGVNLRVAFFYAADATAYDRSILKEIGATITLDE